MSGTDRQPEPPNGARWGAGEDDQGPFGPTEPVHPSVLVLWRLAGVIRAAIVAAVSMPVAQMAAGPISLVIGLAAFVVAAAIFVVWWPPLRYRRLRYRVDEQFLYVRDGVLRQREKIIPVSRMQHVDIERGVFERMLGLASLAVFTAGGSGATFRLPGLSLARGRALRDRILEAKDAP